VNLLLLLLAPIIKQLNNINRKLDQIMSDVVISQEALDAFATEINESVDAVAAEIKKLVDDTGNPLTAADVTGLTAAVDKLKALEPPAVEPVEEPHPDQTLPGDL
jgi:hypothetical protein